MPNLCDIPAADTEDSRLIRMSLVSLSPARGSVVPESSRAYLGSLVSLPCEKEAEEPKNPIQSPPRIFC